MDPFTIKRGNTSPSLLYALPAKVVSATGAKVPFSLAGATAQFSLRLRDGARTKIISLAQANILTNGLTIVDGRELGPILEYVWKAGDTNLAALHEGEFKITFSDGFIQTFPPDSYIPVSIHEDI